MSKMYYREMSDEHHKAGQKIIDMLESNNYKDNIVILGRLLVTLIVSQGLPWIDFYTPEDNYGRAAHIRVELISPKQN